MTSSTCGCDSSHIRDASASNKIGFAIVVNSCSKLVAFSLLLSLLASPAVAMAGCWAHGSMQPGQPCEPHCPKMAAMMERMAERAPSSIGAASSMPECCSVSPSRPVPISQLNAPNGNSAFIVPAVRVAAHPVVRPKAIRSNSAAPPPTHSPSQTLLCTFLI